MKKTLITVLLLGGLLAMVSCSRSGDDAALAGQECPAVGISAFDRLPPDAVLVTVGDQKLTKRDVHANISLLVKLTKRMTRKEMEDQRIDVIRKNVCAGIMKTFIDRERFYAVTSTNIVSIPPSFMKESREAFLRRFTKDGEKVGEYDFKLTAAERRQLDLMVERTASLNAYYMLTCSNDVTVTEAEITNTLNRVREWNRIIAETNVFAHVTATNILRWVKEGKDFGDLADVYSRPQSGRPEPGGLVECADSVIFSNGQTDYFDEVMKLAPGQVSRILEVNEGLEIVKMLKPDPSNQCCRVQRIVLPKGMPYRDYSREEVIALGEREGRTNVQRRLKAAAAGIKVEYPNGVNVLGVPQAQKPPFTPQVPMR